MIHEDEIVFLFKILLIGYDKAIENTWEDLKIDPIPESENIVTGVKFGVKNYAIEINGTTIGTKIFYCAFNPLSIDQNLRKSYYRGTNGVLITLRENDETSNLKESINNIIEVNKDVIPVINMVLTGNTNAFSKADLFIKNELKNSAENFSLEDLEEKTGFKSLLVNEQENIQKKELIVYQISELIKRAG
jgi:GTPase SAR1 family protein